MKHLIDILSQRIVLKIFKDLKRQNIFRTLRNICVLLVIFQRGNFYHVIKIAKLQATNMKLTRSLSRRAIILQIIFHLSRNCWRVYNNLIDSLVNILYKVIKIVKNAVRFISKTSGTLLEINAVFYFRLNLLLNDEDYMFDSHSSC